MKNKTIFTILSITISSSIFAQSHLMVENSQPGQWEFSLEVKENSKVLHKNIIKKCVTPEDLKLNKSVKLDEFIKNSKLQCVSKRFDNTSITSEIEMSCKNKDNDNSLNTVNIKTFYKSKKLNNSMNISYDLTEKDGTNKKVVTTISGKRIGECEVK